MPGVSNISHSIISGCVHQIFVSLSPALFFVENTMQANIFFWVQQPITSVTRILFTIKIMMENVLAKKDNKKLTEQWKAFRGDKAKGTEG